MARKHKTRAGLSKSEQVFIALRGKRYFVKVSPDAWPLTKYIEVTAQGTIAVTRDNRRIPVPSQDYRLEACLARVESGEWEELAYGEEDAS